MKTKITISKTDFLAQLVTLAACEPARRFVGQHTSDDAEEIYAACDQTQWLCFLWEKAGLMSWDRALVVGRAAAIKAEKKFGCSVWSYMTNGPKERAHRRFIVEEMRRRVPWSKVAAYLTA